MESILLVAYLIGMAATLARARISRLVKSSLYARVVFDEKNNLAFPIIGALSTLAGFSLLAVGFILFPWWVPIAAFFGFSILVAYLSPAHIEIHVGTMTIYDLVTLASAIFLWVHVSQ